ncbi:MAG: hypothetical protein PVI44_03875 [Balneolaceae bacterium]|jgi:hypothetical protein
MSYVKWYFLLLFCVVLSGNLRAQDATKSYDTIKTGEIIPGSEELRLNSLHPYQYQYELMLVAGGQQMNIGTLTDEVRIYRKKKTVERIQVLKRPNQPQHMDSVRAVLNSLAPLSHNSQNQNRIITLNFSPSGVEGSYHFTDSATVEINDRFDQPYFDSNWVDLIIRLLPLKKGYERTIDTHEVAADGTSGFVPYQVEVTDQVKLKGRDGKSVKAWVVTQNKEDRITRYYIRVGSLEVIKMEVPISDERKMVMRRRIYR